MMRDEAILLCIVTLIVSSTLMHNVMAIPLPPCAFYGYVYVGGEPAQDDLNITAVIQGTTLKWTTETKSGTYGWPIKGSSEFWIPSNDPETSEKDGGVTGNRIEFYIQGIKTSQTATFDSMSAVNLDLSISEIPDNQNEQSESSLDPYLLYATLIVIVIGVSSAAAFWIHRKGYRIKVSKPKKRSHHAHEENRN